MPYRQPEIDSAFFTPRTYQLELLDKAKKRNLIIPLGTGSGKTFIAVMLIREMAADVRIPLENGGKRTIFLVTTVALVEQQAAHIEAHSNLSVGQYHGKMGIDLWDKATWHAELNKHHVMVMTAQIFLDLLNHGYYCMEKVNLLVLDECHHATKEHPYKVIMRIYKQETKRECQPRVLGLTASVINSNTKPENLNSLIADLEQALSAVVETTSDLVTLSKYGAKPDVLLVACDNFNGSSSPLFKAVHSLLMDAVKFAKDANYNPEFDVDPTKPVEEAFGRTLTILAQLGPWCAWKVAHMQERNLQKLLQYQMTEDQKFFIQFAQTFLRWAKRLLEPLVKDVKTVEQVLQCTPPKVARLLEILEIYKPEGRDGVTKCADEFSCIIFVEQRYVAFVMKVLLRSIARWNPEKYGFLKVDFVVGYSGYKISLDEQKSLHKRQEDVLRNFRQKNLNLLVATSVLEEGVDVRQCNCVIRFDAPKEYRSHIQSKGRARKAGSRYFMLAEQEELEALSFRLDCYGKIEKILLKHCRTKDNPPDAFVDVQTADQLIPPYFPKVPEGAKVEGRPRVSMSTAIALVNRYCARLPSDIFTRLTPRSKTKTVQMDDGVVLYQDSLVLPINSPVKDEIIGQMMGSRKLAQMAVALKACILLHERGELDHHLLPVGKEALKIELFNDDDDEAWPTDGRAHPGSSKRRQYYDKKVADVLTNCAPQADQAAYVHLIELSLSIPAQGVLNPKQRLITDPASGTRCFGILATKPLPKVPVFPVYTRLGELMVKVCTLPKTFTVNSAQLADLEQFHAYLFTDLLRLVKYSMVYAPSEAKSAVLVVPLKKALDRCTEANDEFTLDWSFLRDVVNVINSFPRVPSEEDRAAFMFQRERFVDVIVTPWYRNADQPHFYYVADVCDTLNPASPFPDDEYESFNEYFHEKYCLDIYNQEQPLLDVDYTSSRLNVLTPRFFSKRGHLLPGVDGKTPTATQKQILVPELVDVHPMPASFWHMLVCLPSVFYRLNHLLLADEFRMRVQCEVFHKPTAVSPDFEWRPLEFDWQKNLQAFIESISASDVPEDGKMKYVVADEVEGLSSSRLTANDAHDLTVRSTRTQKSKAVTIVSPDELVNGELETEPVPSVCNSSQDTNMSPGNSGGFTIGVWNPFDACAPPCDLAPAPLEPITKKTNDPQPHIDDDPLSVLGQFKVGGIWTEQQLDPPVPPESTAVAMDDATDDVWDFEMEEGNVYFDIDYKRHFMGALQTQLSAAVGHTKDDDEDAASSGGDLQRVTAFDIDRFAPKENIVATGWGDEASVADETIVKLDQAKGGGLQFLSTKTEEIFDPNALLDDIMFDDMTSHTVQRPQNGFKPVTLPDVGAPKAVVHHDHLCTAAGARRPDIRGRMGRNLVGLESFVEEDTDAKPQEETLRMPEDENVDIEQSSMTGPPNGVQLVSTNCDLRLDVMSPQALSSESYCANNESDTATSDSSEMNGSAEETDLSEGVGLVDFAKLPPLVAAAIPFSFEVDRVDSDVEGPNPCFILQALTMSNANDGINLERLETVGDSFLKYAITVYLFYAHPDRHEGKLSFLRSKQVSNYNLYKLGKRKGLGTIMVASKFEPNDNWLPPGYKAVEPAPPQDDVAQIEKADEAMDLVLEADDTDVPTAADGLATTSTKWQSNDDVPLIPYNMLAQHSIPDKSIADSVEALIGVYLLTYGPRGALKFMQWLGLKVLPENMDHFEPPRAPLLRIVPNPEQQLSSMWLKYDFASLETVLKYRFRDKAYLIQAFTHASYHYNRITDCYQRLEFLGDAVLDFLITRYLYQDGRQHSPGVLTDLRSALVNNTIFASLAVKYEFHKYFLAICPGLFSVIGKFVRMQQDRSFDMNFDEELYLLDQEDNCDAEEDVEVPKSLGDIFESVAGAIFLDSGYSLDAVWQVYLHLMGDLVERCCSRPPKSPIRELLELEPETAKFSRAERVVTEGKVRVTVDVYGKGRFTGVGRNYRIAKTTAAKRALRFLKKHQL